MSLISNNEIENLLKSINKSFPTCVAAILADNDGFVIGSSKKLPIDEKLLAIQSICKDRKILNLEGFQKYLRPLSKDVNLFLVANQDKNNLVNYNRLIKTLKRYKL